MKCAAISDQNGSSPIIKSLMWPATGWTALADSGAGLTGIIGQIDQSSGEAGVGGDSTHSFIPNCFSQRPTLSVQIILYV